MTMRGLVAALLMGSVTGAQKAFPVDTPAVEYSFPQSCSVVRPAALTYFQKESLPLAPDPSCADCLTGTTKRLHDEAGRRLLSNRTVIRQYTIDDKLKYQKIGPVTQIVHLDLHADAKLRLQAEGVTCRASLHFLYGWYGAYLVLGFPVDGDGDGGYSNGKLETAYLHALQQQIDRAAIASSTSSIH